MQKVHAKSERTLEPSKPPEVYGSRLAGSESRLAGNAPALPPLVPPKLRPLVPPKQNINKSQEDITRINKVDINTADSIHNLFCRKFRKFPVAVLLVCHPRQLFPQSRYNV